VPRSTPGKCRWSNGGWRAALADAGRVLLGGLALFWVLRTFVVEAFTIPTPSMAPTLLPGDFLWVDKTAYGRTLPLLGWPWPGWREPARGDVVVFRPLHDPVRVYVKRIVGVPGDTLAMRDKVLYRNGHPVVEPYARTIDVLPAPTDTRLSWQRRYAVTAATAAIRGPTRDDWGPLVVPPGRYFVLGDNRDNSDDSRYWGFVPRERLVGRAWFVYFSFDRDPRRPVPWLTAIRWERLGRRVR